MEFYLGGNKIVKDRKKYFVLSLALITGISKIVSESCRTYWLNFPCNEILNSLDIDVFFENGTFLNDDFKKTIQ